MLCILKRFNLFSVDVAHSLCGNSDILYAYDLAYILVHNLRGAYLSTMLVLPQPERAIVTAEETPET